MRHLLIGLLSALALVCITGKAMADVTYENYFVDAAGSIDAERIAPGNTARTISVGQTVKVQPWFILTGGGSPGTYSLNISAPGVAIFTGIQDIGGLSPFSNPGPSISGNGLSVSPLGGGGSTAFTGGLARSNGLLTVTAVANGVVTIGNITLTVADPPPTCEETLDECTGEQVICEEMIADLGPELASCQGALGSCEDTVASLGDSFDASQAELAGVQASLATCSSNLSTSQGDALVCQSDLAATGNALAGTQAALNVSLLNVLSCESDLSDAHAETASCNDSLEGAQNAASSCSSQLSTNQDVLAAAYAAGAACEANLDIANDAVNSSAAENAACRVNLGNAEASLATCSENLTSAQTAIAEAQTQYGSSQESLSACVLEAEATHQDLEVAYEERNTCQSNLETSQSMLTGMAGELAVAQAELAALRVSEANTQSQLDAALADADDDGVRDAGDTCPGTQAGVTVDSVGCDAVQYCSAIVSRPAICNHSDFSNDEPIGNPRDCMWVRTKVRKGAPKVGVCQVRPANDNSPDDDND